MNLDIEKNDNKNDSLSKGGEKSNTISLPSEPKKIERVLAIVDGPFGCITFDSMSRLTNRR
jgi:hypothetical protein